MPEMDTIELERLYAELEKIERPENKEEKRDKDAIIESMLDPKFIWIGHTLMVADAQIFTPALKEIEKIENERERELRRYYLYQRKQMFMKDLYKRLSERLSS